MSHNARVEAETGNRFRKERTQSRNGGSIPNFFNLDHLAGASIMLFCSWV